MDATFWNSVHFWAQPPAVVFWMPHSGIPSIFGRSLRRLLHFGCHILRFSFIFRHFSTFFDILNILEFFCQDPGISQIQRFLLSQIQKILHVFIECYQNPQNDFAQVCGCLSEQILEASFVFGLGMRCQFWIQSSLLESNRKIFFLKPI